MKTSKQKLQLISLGKLVFSIFLIIGIMVACGNNDDNYSEEVPIGINSEDIIIIKSLGFNTEKIVDIGSYYIVEGDIGLDKKHLKDYGKTNQTSDSKRLKQARTNDLVSIQKVANITVGIDWSLPIIGADSWHTAIEQAIGEWNNIVGCNVHFSMTSSSSPDILISNDFGINLENDVAASATFPLNGNPGPNIYINLDFNSNQILSDSQKKLIMVHELGHCLGLRHTNWQQREESTIPITIPGTPTIDPFSVMNGGTAGDSWQGFSQYDIIAIKTLYPFVLTIIANTSNVCANENVSYSLNSTLPTGSTITWQGITNMTLVSGQGTTTAVFQSSNRKYGKVRATIVSNGQSNILENSNVWVGSPGSIGPSGMTFHLNDVEIYTIMTLNAIAGATTNTWSSFPSGINVTFQGDDAILYFPTPGTYQFYCIGTNSCGEYTLNYEITVNNSNGLTPNPGGVNN